MMKLIKLYFVFVAFALLLLGSLNSSAQQFNKEQTSCFASVMIQDSMITVFIPDPMSGGNFRMHPTVFYDHVFYVIYPFMRYSYHPEDIAKDVERIKNHLKSQEIKTLTEQEQQIVLNELVLSLIWKNLFKTNQDEIEQQLSELENHISSKNKQALELVIHLYHQVFDCK